MTMKPLGELLRGLPCQILGNSQTPITDITFDSRKVAPGALFVALKGIHHDGNAFIPPALKAGAAAVLSDREIATGQAACVISPDPIRLLAPLAARFWDYPSRNLFLVGITGTNGKTTSSYLIESILKAAGKKPAVIGTINYRFSGVFVPAPNTTPFASELQRFLSDARQAGCNACVMEVSSHALAMGRVEDVEFDVGVFTNLTQDHLDFHGTMDAYAAAKTILFKSLGNSKTKASRRAAILNMDDPRAGQMASVSEVPILGYQLRGHADLTTKGLICDAQGSRFELVGPKGYSFPVNLPLLGDYNVANALAAIGVGISQGYSAEAIQRGLETVSGVPGRMERVSGQAPFTVVVDYAHTDDALRKVLCALRKLAPKRLLTVFGCGGDRDRTKRPLMGQAAAELSEEVFVTSDNPRSEDPGKIALDIEVGIRRVRPDHYRIVLDREEAINAALSQAQPGDVVLIAGKGHEGYQILKDRSIPFDDRDTARNALGRLGLV